MRAGILVCLGLASACAGTNASPPRTLAEAPAPSRSPGWAAPVTRPGLSNLFRVNERLYRGAQPTAEGMRELRALGVKTVVNLRWLHSDRDEIGSLELGYEHIYMKAWHAEDEDVIQFLRIATDPAKQPVFLHCQHGSDRTGTMIAVYRMAVDGWTADEAIDEMMRGGYGYHSMWTNLTEYLRELDVERIRREAGISPSRSDRWADSEIR